MEKRARAVGAHRELVVDDANHEELCARCYLVPFPLPVPLLRPCCIDYAHLAKSMLDCFGEALRDRVRVGQAAKLRDLYARFGQALRTNSPRWRLAILSANPRLDAELRLPLKERLKTQNGGIPVRLLTADVPAGSNDPAGE